MDLFFFKNVVCLDLELELTGYTLVVVLVFFIAICYKTLKDYMYENNLYLPV